MFEIRENRRVLPDGTEITTYSRDILSANILEVEAGTTGYKGGDSGHGGRTYFRIADAAGTDNAFSNNWTEEWQRIEKIALEVHPAWTDTILQAALQFAASTASPVRHSEAFRQAYNPHYRIINNKR